MPDIFINRPSENKKKKEESPPKAKVNDEFSPSAAEASPDHNHNPLSAYCYFPHGVDFMNKEPDEKIILLTRRHILTNAGWVAAVIIMIFAPLLFRIFPFLDFLPTRFQFVAILFWYLVTLVIFIQGFLGWFFSVNLITNKRVIDVDFENLIYRKITDAEIGHIEDVTVQMGSVVRTIFDYGDVLIQTAAEVPKVAFEAVPHPDRIDKILSDLRMQVT